MIDDRLFLMSNTIFFAVIHALCEICGQKLEKILEDAPLISMKQSSQERAKFAHFSIAFVGFDCVFSRAVIRIFIFLQL